MHLAGMRKLQWQTGLPAKVLANASPTTTGHSNYLRLNDTVSHDQVRGNPGFTGVTLANRLAAAGNQ